MKDIHYWDEFYKTDPPINHPSDFAKSVLKYMQKGNSVVDLGCGNGRDSIYFAEYGLKVLGVDSSRTAIDYAKKTSSKNIEYFCCDFINNSQLYSRTYDFFYSRFTLHAISEENQSTLLRNVYNNLSYGGLFFIEVRGTKDDIFGKGEPAGRNAYIYNGHFRRFIVYEEIVAELGHNGFGIIYSEESRGFAKFDNEDPIVIRVIAKNRNNQAK